MLPSLLFLCSIYITLMVALLISTHFRSAHVIFSLSLSVLYLPMLHFSLEKKAFICLWLLSHSVISVMQWRLLAKFYLKCRIHNSRTLRLNQWSLQKRRRKILRARETGSLLQNCVFYKPKGLDIGSLNKMVVYIWLDQGQHQ